MSNVISLTRPIGDDIPAALRLIADDIENGDYSFAPTKAALVFADEEADASGGILSMATHGLGARCHSHLIVVGLLQYAVGKMTGTRE